MQTCIKYHFLLLFFMHSYIYFCFNSKKEQLAETVITCVPVVMTWQYLLISRMGSPCLVIL